MTGEAYIGTKRCGCPVAAVLNDPRDPQGTKCRVREFITHAGYRINEVSLRDAQRIFLGCACRPEFYTEVERATEIDVT